MTNTSRVTATPGATANRAAASSSPTSAEEPAPGGVSPAVALDPTSETVKGAPPDPPAAVHEPPDGRSRPVADSGGQGPATASDPMLPGEVAVPATAAVVPSGPSPGGFTITRRPVLLDDVRRLATRSTLVKVREGIL